MAAVAAEPPPELPVSHFFKSLTLLTGRFCGLSLLLEGIAISG
jgi:hypothetical protein